MAEKKWDFWEPFYKDGLILAWKSNHMCIKCDIELFTHSQTSAVALLRFWECISNFIPRFIMGEICITPGIKVNSLLYKWPMLSVYTKNRKFD